MKLIRMRLGKQYGTGTRKSCCNQVQPIAAPPRVQMTVHLRMKFPPNSGILQRSWLLFPRVLIWVWAAAIPRPSQS
ncbi:hypothetical protein D3C81_1898010 [compost metagenome]